MRLVVSVLLAIGALLGVGAATLEPATAQAPTTTIAERTHTESNDGGRPSALPRPGEHESPSNTVGFLVGLGLFSAWVIGVIVLFRRAAQRRRVPVPTA